MTKSLPMNWLFNYAKENQAAISAQPCMHWEKHTIQVNSNASHHQSADPHKITEPSATRRRDVCPRIRVGQFSGSPKRPITGRLDSDAGRQLLLFGNLGRSRGTLGAFPIRPKGRAPLFFFQGVCAPRSSVISTVLGVSIRGIADDSHSEWRFDDTDLASSFDLRWCGEYSRGSRGSCRNCGGWGAVGFRQGRETQNVGFWNG